MDGNGTGEAFKYKARSMIRDAVSCSSGNWGSSFEMITYLSSRYEISIGEVFGIIAVKSRDMAETYLDLIQIPRLSLDDEDNNKRRRYTL